MDQRSTDVVETCFSPGYSHGPPWSFTGSALYQLHLVRAEIAQAFIPKELKLVEAFGYTLGGFFLAHYEDSPAGMFDELVVIAGIVWNPPTSCAWAARVLVNSNDACKHGQKAIGLPSHEAVFSKKRALTLREKRTSKGNGFLSMFGMDSASFYAKEHSEIQVSEFHGFSQMSLCTINLPFVVPTSKSDKSMGPRIRMSLPSFSGQTIHNPQLLKYSCQIDCRVRFVEAAKISGPGERVPQKHNDDHESEDKIVCAEAGARDRGIAVLLSKPILALQFNHLKMQVEAPTVLLPHHNN